MNNPSGAISSAPAPRCNLVQQFETLRHHRRTEGSNAGEIAPRVVKARNQAEADRVFAHIKDNGNCSGRPLRRIGGGNTERDDDGYMSADEVCCQAGQPVELSLSEGGLDNDVLALNEPCFLESLTDRVDNFHLGGRGGCQQSNHRHRRLLRPRRERPRCRCAAEQRYELAPPHSITSSARTSSVGGISRPSALAVVGPEPSHLMRCGVLSVNIVLWGASERGGP